MDAKRSVAGRLADIGREYETPLTNEEWVQLRLRWEDWAALRREAVDLAKQEIRRRKWRGAKRGLLPGGFSAEDVGGQAIAELLGGKCRLAAGLVRAKVSAELKRLVQQKVRSLHRLREASALRSEWEVLAEGEDAEPVSVFDHTPGEDSGDREGPNGLLGQEAMVKFLNGDRELLGVLECLRAGVKNPAQIAQRLGISEKGAMRARRRLGRRLAEIGEELGGGFRRC